MSVVSKIYAAALFAFLLISCKAYAQYDIKCEYLSNPDKAKGYVDSCARFWFRSYDTLYGGFFSNAARNGSVTDNNSKNMLTQSRTSYGMARAFMMSGDTTFLKYARGSMDFMYTYAWDSVNGGWFNEMDAKGNVLSGGEHNKDKWSFMQHYALLGITAMSEAFHDKKDIDFMFRARSVVDSNLWDSRPQFKGYYNTASEDWSGRNGKGFTPTMDGITTHVLSMYLINWDEIFKQRLLDAADNAVQYLRPAMEYFNYGFPEEFDSDWQPVLSNTYVFTGHLLKTAWCLTRAYLVEPKQEYLDFSSEIIDEVLAKGYDTLYGAPYKEYNGLTGKRYDNNKEWWELEQAFNSGIMNYYITSEEKYLKMADETLEFYMKYFVDHQYGEVFQTTSRTGTPTTTQKASYWKAGYHSIELGYYIYLYGNLYLHRQPVNLYYYFPQADSERVVKLTPIAIQEDELIIKSVEVGNSPYNKFIPRERKLVIPAGTAGIFKVTFMRPESDAVADAEPVYDFSLSQNYPNPFNPVTRINYSVGTGTETAKVNLKIYDIMGKEVAVIVDGYKSPGYYTIEFNGASLSSGVYFYKLQASSGGSSYSFTKKFILLK